MRRRFQKRICINLPDAAARTGILKNKGQKTPNTLTDEDWVELGNMAEGYSGSDMSIVFNEALMMPLRRCQNATRFKRTASGGWLPTFPSDPEGQNMRLYDMSAEQSANLRSPPVTMDDFRDAIMRNKPSVGQEDLQQYDDWTAEFGQDA